MPGIGSLIGADGVIEQLLLWGVVNQVVSALASPAFQLLAQDVAAAHPEVVIDPTTLATAVARNLIGEAEGRQQAARSGINAGRFATLLDLATVRIPPADLATAVLRSYVDLGDAQAQALPQGVDAEALQLMINLAGDAPGPDQLATALLRGIIPADGTGPDAVSFTQGIAEGRLHDKWADMLRALSAAVLSPPDAASAVVRNFLPAADGEQVAALSGVDAAMFRTLVQLSGDAPGPQQLAEALRRGVIPLTGTGGDSTSFTQGIAEGRLADKWAPVIQALSTQWPTPVDALAATLEGQVSYDEGLALYERLGGDPQFFDVLFRTRGSAPTPLELVEMANRGIIPWDGTGPDATSYEQGFLEGPWRDKWASAYRRVAAYVPPAGTVVTMLARGAIDNAQATALLAKQGMSEELIAAFLEDAHVQALGEYRGLSVTVALDAYKAHLVTSEQLTDILTSLHVTPEAATLMREYADFQRAFAQVSAAVSRIRALYVARKITPETALDALVALNVPPSSVPEMLSTWALENAISVRTLTEAQIIKAWKHDVLSNDEAITELANIGYTAFDSWVLLSNEAGAPLPDKPVPGAPALISMVVPGTT